MAPTRKFPWTERTTNLLITLYGENIKSFMDPHKSQIKLWRRLVELMKEQNLAEELKEILNEGHAQRKWNFLRQRFKVAFYDPKLQQNFPYYDRMEQMFTEYALFKLDKSMHEATQAELSAYVETCLDTIAAHIDAVRCEDGDSDDSPLRPQDDEKSEATKVRQYIAKLPRASIAVSQASLKVMPNTPFNRNYQLATIINQKYNSFVKSQRNSDEPKLKKAHLDFDSFESPEDLTIIESLDETSNEKLFKVESLDECDLSGIHDGAPTSAMNPVKFIPKYSTKFDESHKLVIKKSFKAPVKPSKISTPQSRVFADLNCDISGINNQAQPSLTDRIKLNSKFSKNFKRSHEVVTKNSFKPPAPGKPSKISTPQSPMNDISNVQDLTKPSATEPVKFVQKYSNNFQGGLKLVMKKPINPPVPPPKISTIPSPVYADQSSSILEVPSLPSINILNVETLPSMTSIATPLTNETLRAAPDLRVIPRNLNWTEKDSSSAGNENHPPQWFQSFLTRYDSDMSQINTKMDLIQKKLDKIIDQTNF